MADREIKPKRKPPRHPMTGPVQTDTMPDRPNISIGPEAGEMKRQKSARKPKVRRGPR